MVETTIARGLLDLKVDFLPFVMEGPKNQFTRKSVKQDLVVMEQCRGIANRLTTDSPVGKIIMIVAMALGSPPEITKLLTFTVHSIEIVLDEQPKEVDQEAIVQKFIDVLGLKWLKDQLQKLYWP